MTEVAPGGTADMAGIEASDIVVSINQRRMGSVGDTRTAVGDASKLGRSAVLAQIARGDETAFVVIAISKT